MYEPRLYRKNINADRFEYFNISYLETDLWIGIDKNSFMEEIKTFILNEIIKLRKVCDSYIYSHPIIKEALTPLDLKEFVDAPNIIKDMILASDAPKIGPMGAIAGAFSQYIGKIVIKNFDIKEIVIENGGDIFAKIKNPITVSIYAGNSPLSEKIGIEIDAYDEGIGICSSAGTVGPSLSFGIADAVMIICKDTLLADAYATSFANKVKNKSDLDYLINDIKKNNDILAGVFICQDKLAVCTKRFRFHYM